MAYSFEKTNNATFEGTIYFENASDFADKAMEFEGKAQEEFDKLQQYTDCDITIELDALTKGSDGTHIASFNIDYGLVDTVVFETEDYGYDIYDGQEAETVLSSMEQDINDVFSKVSQDMGMSYEWDISEKDSSIPDLTQAIENHLESLEPEYEPDFDY